MSILYSFEDALNCKHAFKYWEELQNKIYNEMFRNKKCCFCDGTGKYKKRCDGKGSVRTYNDCEMPGQGVVDINGDLQSATGYYTVKCGSCKGNRSYYTECHVCDGTTEHQKLNGNYDPSRFCIKCIDSVLKRTNEMHKSDHKKDMFAQCKRCSIYFNKNDEIIKKNKCTICRIESNNCVIF
jgi:hypothetical protein